MNRMITYPFSGTLTLSLNDKLIRLTFGMFLCIQEWSAHVALVHCSFKHCERQWSFRFQDQKVKRPYSKHGNDVHVG